MNLHVRKDRFVCVLFLCLVFLVKRRQFFRISSLYVSSGQLGIGTLSESSAGRPGNKTPYSISPYMLISNRIISTFTPSCWRAKVNLYPLRMYFEGSQLISTQPFNPYSASKALIQLSDICCTVNSSASGRSSRSSFYKLFSGIKMNHTTRFFAVIE